MRKMEKNRVKGMVIKREIGLTCVWKEREREEEEGSELLGASSG